MQWCRVFVFLFVAVLGASVQSVAATDLNVGFVQVSRLLTEPPQVKIMLKKLKAEFSRRNEKLTAQQVQIKKLEQKLSKEGSIMSTSEAKRLERDILSRRLKLKNAREELQQEKQLRQSEEVDRLRKVISEVIADVAKREKLDIVLEGGVTWASDRADVTGKVLKRLAALQGSKK